MAAYKGANVTKVDAGGSGDNYVADGYIKTVEKVWIDSYAMGTVAVTSADTICIGKVPKGKKLTDVIVNLPALGTVTGSTVVLSTTVIGNAGTAGTLGLMHGIPGNANTAVDPTTISVAIANTLRLNPAHIGTEMASDVNIYMLLGHANTLTNGTIRSIVKYT